MHCKAKARSHCCLGRINLSLKCEWLSAVPCPPSARQSVASRHVTTSHPRHPRSSIRGLMLSGSSVFSFLSALPPLSFKGLRLGLCPWMCCMLLLLLLPLSLLRRQLQQQQAIVGTRQLQLLRLRLCLVLLLGLYMPGHNTKGVKFSPCLLATANCSGPKATEPRSQ